MASLLSLMKNNCGLPHIFAQSKMPAFVYFMQSNLDNGRFLCIPKMISKHHNNYEVIIGNCFFSADGHKMTKSCMAR